MVQPHLIAIYREVVEPRLKTEQIGTGFRVNYEGYAVLITAKHTLYGHNDDENPWEKAIFVAGSLQMIGHLRSHELVRSKDHDLVAMRVDELNPGQCFPSLCLSPVDAKPIAVTILGFLARDFRRDATSAVLRPAPYIYTNFRRDLGTGYIGLRYPKSRNRSTDSGKKVMAPRPSGMSGGPMLDSDKLANGELSIIGVFTDYCRERGMAFGESSARLMELLGGI